MLESLNLHFAFYDWLLVFMVTALGVFSAYTKDPQLKAVAATIPIPCGFAYIAVGLPMGAANAISGFMCFLYVHIVRIIHYKVKIPIIPSIALGLAFFVALGTFLMPIVPDTEAMFLGVCAFDFIVGIIFFQKQKYKSGVRYKTPLPVYIKVSYESRYSLGDQCRQLPLFLIAGPIMFIEMRYLEIYLHLNHWIVLLCGYALFACIYWPLNQELKRRNERADASYSGEKK